MTIAPAAQRLGTLLFFLASALPAAAPRTAVLSDDLLQLPADDWRWVRFEIRQHRPATAECRFETIGAGAVRAELVNRPNLELFHDHKHHEVMGSTDTMPAGGLSLYIEDPGEYAIIIENTGDRPVSVRLNVSLTFGPPQQPASRYLSTTRRLTVILLSFAAFFAIVTFSARALLRAVKTRVGER